MHDSYFDASIWPERVKALVPGFGQTCVLGSHIFIHPAYRKCQSGLPIKQVVCALSMAHLNGTKPDVLLGMVRIERGLDKVFRNSGAISLVDEVIWWYYIQVGLIALFPARVPLSASSPLWRFRPPLLAVARMIRRLLTTLSVLLGLGFTLGGRQPQPYAAISSLPGTTPHVFFLNLSSRRPGSALDRHLGRPSALHHQPTSLRLFSGSVRTNCAGATGRNRDARGCPEGNRQ
jgi:hypothetical protein